MDLQNTKIESAKGFFLNLKNKFRSIFRIQPTGLSPINPPEKIGPKQYAYWVIEALLGLYVVALIVVAALIYGFQKDTKALRQMTNIFPLPVAIVGPDTVWANTYYQQLGFLENFSKYSKQALPADAQKQLLDQLIENRIIARETRKIGVKTTKPEIDDAIKAVSDQNNGMENVNKLLKDIYGMTLTDFEELVHDQILRDKARTELLEQVHVRHILLSNEGKAKEILDKTRQPNADFAALAKEFSEDTASKENGGDLGFVARGLGLDPAFEEAAFKAELKKPTDLVKTQFGFHIIFVEEKKGKAPMTYEQYLEDQKKHSVVLRLIRT